MYVLLLVHTLLPLSGGSSHSKCLHWLLDTYANQCDALARDTVHQFVLSGRGYLSQMDPCSCDATALFVTYYFSPIAALSKMEHRPVTNATFSEWQQYTGLQTFNHLNSKYYFQCTQPPLSEHQQTFQEIRCNLGLGGSCNSTANAQQLLQIYIKSNPLGTGHTFVIQHVTTDEYYIWMGYIGAYDLHTWIKQDPFAGRNFTGGKSRYAGKLNATQMNTFITKLDQLSGGYQPWGSVNHLWEELFWTTPAMPNGSRCKGFNSTSTIRLAVTYWTEDYTSENCAVSPSTFSVAWGPAHQKKRDHMCDGKPKVKPCSGAQG
eukprot:TRINITY_DN75375_c0_g1_i1.p1 TRINITY_DN75375_c0_g1~~TRINITY_DN75375_c0_g1_i1.p1  ORF type:complete len:328 (+),score=22.17 TRINITY_DN75375_c0_g1_i1:30-986(+)